MAQVNSIAICKEDYGSAEEFKNTIRDTVMLLLDANYETTVRYDEKVLELLLLSLTTIEIWLMVTLFRIGSALKNLRVLSGMMRQT